MHINSVPSNTVYQPGPWISHTLSGGAHRLARSSIHLLQPQRLTIAGFRSSFTTALGPSQQLRLCKPSPVDLLGMDTMETPYGVSTEYIRLQKKPT